MIDIAGVNEMEKNSTVCFQTTSEIIHTLEAIAAVEHQSVSSVVESIVYHHLKENKSIEDMVQNRRRSERKQVNLMAYIGDPRWQRREFKAGTITNISFGGIRFSVPKGMKLEIQNEGETKEFSVIFTLPNNLWPINVKISLQWVFESAEEVQIGAALMSPNFYACSALQKYMN